MVERQRIGKTQIASLQPDQTIWDTAVVGFGARRQRSTAITYFLMYRGPDGKQRRFTIGRHGPLTPDQARDRAKTFQGQLVRGDDPAAKKAAEKLAPDVSKLCDDYLSDAENGKLLTRRRLGKKPSTIATDTGRIKQHIKPLLGNLKVSAVTRDDIEKFMHDVAAGKTAKREKTNKRYGLALVTGGRGTATRTVGLLGSIFSYAVAKRLRNDNPVHGVVRFADRRKERRLADAEYAKLGAGLRNAQSEMWPPAIAAARFLILTGWRRGEALNLTWPEIDLDRRTATLLDSKTGRSVRPLSEAACDILREIKRPEGLVFRAARGDGAMNGFPGFFKKIISAGALLADVTPHVLRHSYASLASDLGYSEATIATLIGHSRHSMTSRYIHSADAVLLASADAIASEILKLLLGNTTNTKKSAASASPP